MCGRAVVARSRSMTVPSGCSCCQASAKRPVKCRETEVRRALESIRSSFMRPPDSVLLDGISCLLVTVNNCQLFSKQALWSNLVSRHHHETICQNSFSLRDRWIAGTSDPAVDDAHPVGSEHEWPDALWRTAEECGRYFLARSDRAIAHAGGEGILF